MNRERPAPATLREAERLLAEVFVRGGCFRTPDPKRRKADGQSYKKGYEVRLPVSNDRELAHLRRCLNRIGIKPARPYKKHRQVIQVVYGKSAVAAFAELLAHAGVKSPKTIDLEIAS